MRRSDVLARGKAERRYAGVTHMDVVGFGPDQARQVQDTMSKNGLADQRPRILSEPSRPGRRPKRRTTPPIFGTSSPPRNTCVGVVNTFIGRDFTKSRSTRTGRVSWKHGGRSSNLRKTTACRIGIENCPMSFTDEWPGGKNLATDPAIWRRMFSDIPSENFGLNFDPSHLVLQHDGLLQSHPGVSPRFFHAHAKDADGSTASGWTKWAYSHTRVSGTRRSCPASATSIGASSSPLLSGAGYKGPVCIEVEDRAYEGPVESRKAALVQSARYLRQYMPVAKCV